MCLKYIAICSYIHYNISGACAHTYTWPWKKGRTSSLSSAHRNMHNIITLWIFAQYSVSASKVKFPAQMNHFCLPYFKHLLTTFTGLLWHSQSLWNCILVRASVLFINERWVDLGGCFGCWSTLFKILLGER